MRRMLLLISVLLCSAAAGASSPAAPAAASPPGAGQTVAAQENQPGRPTVARMYVLNRSRSEAIPVVISNTGEPVPVVLAGDATVSLGPNTVVGERALRQVWDYRQITISSGADAATALNAAGAEGWEAVSAASTAGSGTVVLLKRPR
jgi:hypothetical protein